jgi:O-phosphoseryl-tRNA(Sec) selenium transferase, SepSecS
MSIALVLQSLRQKPKNFKVSTSAATNNDTSKNCTQRHRIDQKSCYKAIIAAGLQCIVIPTKIDNDALATDVQALQTAIQTYTPSRILAIITTTSCFAHEYPIKLMSSPKSYNSTTRRMVRMRIATPINTCIISLITCMAYNVPKQRNCLPVP